jgi:23S rRNA pseudouridine2605 synthase
MSVRLNKYIASSTGLSRRAADNAIEEGRVRVNNQLPQAGQQVYEGDQVTLDSQPLQMPSATQTIILNKPVGYIVSRNGQGGRTVYDILPENLHQLKPVGRLDKNSSGLLLLTNDGDLAAELTHPKHQKVKVYQVALNKPLAPLHRQMISDFGIQLEDGNSRFDLQRIMDGDEQRWEITMHEGRNRQIRRTFQALGYDVRKLHRTHFGTYKLPDSLEPGNYQII